MKTSQKFPMLPSILVVSMLSLSVLNAAAPSVQTTRPEVRSVTRETRQPAHLLALHSADIGARVDGYMGELLVDIGDPVKQGDVLARIDAPELVAAKRIALAEQSRLEMSLRSAEANVTAAQAENARINELVAKNSLSEKVALESNSKLAAAKAEFAAAEAESEIAAANLEAADTLLSFTELRAPFDGVIAARFVDLGDQVSIGPKPLFVVEDQSTLRLVTHVPERDAVLVDVGDSVSVRLDAYPGKQFISEVARASRTLSQSAAQRMRVEAEVSNVEGALLAGLYGSATILLEKKDQAIVVPAGVVRVGEGPALVYVVENGVVRHRPVELGLDDGQWIEVVSGLTGNEALVTGLLGRLADGTAVTLR